MSAAAERADLEIPNTDLDALPNVDSDAFGNKAEAILLGNKTYNNPYYASSQYGSNNGDATYRSNLSTVRLPADLHGQATDQSPLSRAF